MNNMKAKSFNEYIGQDINVNEGFFDMFKKRNKEVEAKKKTNVYNPDDIGYDHPDFAKEFPTFEKDPEAEIEEASKQLANLGKGITRQLSQIIIEHQHILEMMKQQDMVNGNRANEWYITQTEDFIGKLEDVEFLIRKGIW